MIELGLQRISRLLSKTPLPWRAIHVAGTNGKGTVCTYVSRMLDAYNKSEYRKDLGATPLKHARFTSPHLIDRWDCITINQETVPYNLFDHLEQRVLERNAKQNIQASEFELLTATAFEVFTHEKVDVGVVEVGMGGRLDATNVIGRPLSPDMPSDVDLATIRPLPLVCAITKIGLDHQAFLGSTLKEIAEEKAGIIKPGVPFTFDVSNGPEIIDTFSAKAAREHSTIFDLTDPSMPIKLLDQQTLYSAFSEEMLNPPHVRRRMHSSSSTQLNLGVAFCAAWKALQRLDRIPDDSSKLNEMKLRYVASLAHDMLSEEIYDVDVPGRLQVLNIDTLTSRETSIILDGAHNEQSAEVLALAVKDSYRKRRGGSVTWVIATSDSKDPIEILKHVIKTGDRIFATEFGPVASMPWIKATSTIKIVDAVVRLAPKVSNLEVHDCGNDVLGALRAASEKAAEGPMVVAGSLYLVGDVLRLLRDSK